MHKGEIDARDECSELIVLFQRMSGVEVVKHSWCKTGEGGNDHPTYRIHMKVSSVTALRTILKATNSGCSFRKPCYIKSFIWADEESGEFIEVSLNIGSNTWRKTGIEEEAKFMADGIRSLCK